MQQKMYLTLIVLSVISLFLIAGCKGGEVPGGAPTTPFLGGSQGLEIKFLQGSPPDEVTDGGVFPFEVVVSLKNKGEEDLTKDQVRVDLRGILATDFGVTDSDITNVQPDANKLTSRKKDSEGNIIEPVETFARIPKNDKDLNFGAGKISGNTPMVFRANVCYQYKTKAIAQICVLKNLIPVADDAICDPSESKAVFSSGSPVRVTSFRQSIIGFNKIQFSFDIVHVSSGRVFEYKTITATDGCPRDATNRRKEENNVNVKVKTGIPNPLKCSMLGSAQTSGGELSRKVKLVDGKRTVTCTQEVDTTATGTDFKKNIDITLEFNYLDSADKNVLVKHLSVEEAAGASPMQPSVPHCSDTIPGVEDEDWQCKVPPKPADSCSGDNTKKLVWSEYTTTQTRCDQTNEKCYKSTKTDCSPYSCSAGECEGAPSPPAPSENIEVALVCKLGSKICDKLSGEAIHKIKELVDALDDGTYAFEATIVSDIGIKSSLDQYDMVILGNSLEGDNDMSEYGEILKGWVENGGDILATAFVAKNMVDEGNIDSILPADGNPGISSGTAKIVRSVTDDITRTVATEFTLSGARIEILGEDDSGFDIMTTVNGGRVVLKTHALSGAGRKVYLGIPYFADYDNENYDVFYKSLLNGTYPEAKKLFLNAVYWAATGEERS